MPHSGQQISRLVGTISVGWPQRPQKRFASYQRASCHPVTAAKSRWRGSASRVQLTGAYEKPGASTVSSRMRKKPVPSMENR